MAIEYTILITDQDLNYVGDPITDWTSIDVTLRFNEPGSGLFTMPAYAWVKDRIRPGRRIVVVRNLGAEYGYQASVLLAGPYEEMLYERSDDGENAALGMLTIHFADDLAKIAGREVYPNPAQTPSAQTTDRWTFTGNAEAALRSLVDGNAAAGALAARRVPGLALGALAGVGSSVTIESQRMQPLGDLMREIAAVGGGIGFRTRQVANQILFEVYAPPDRTAAVRFGFGVGNLRYLSHEVKAPTATTVIVGGQGEGADRALIEMTSADDEASWGRIEKLVSRPGASPIQELQDDGNRALADGASTARVTSNVSDLPDQRFGVDYFLGDRVAIETDPGQYLADLITTVHIQAYNSAAEYVSPTVGSQAARSDPIWEQRLREIDERLGRIERAVKPAVLPA